MAPVEVARLEDLQEATPTIVRATGRRLILVRIGHEVRALRDACPHMDASFAGAAVIGHVSGTPTEPRFEDADPLIVCPWHRYEFSLASGQCVTTSRLSVRTYAVTVCDGRVLVDLSSHANSSKVSST